MSAHMEWTGVNELNEKLAGLTAQATLKASGELRLQAEVVMTYAKQDTPVAVPEQYSASAYRRLTPGALRSSGQIQGPIIEGDKMMYKISFGNNTAYYAVYVHEIMSSKHSVGKAKYLESNVNERAQGIIEAVGLALGEMH